MNQPNHSRLSSHLANLFRRINYEAADRPTPASFRLANMLRLMEALDHPHRKYPIVHVAGTKGKGSVSHFSAAILEACGYRVGLYTSPHLESFHERFRINGQPIGDEPLCELLSVLEPISARLDNGVADSANRPLTFFELSTALAYQYFADCEVDAAVIEVGMGGRLDSTNVCQPVVSVITSISLDHTAQLGETIAEIAGEKAGIIKSGVPVVSGAGHPEASRVIREVARARNAPLWELGSDFQVVDAEIRQDLPEGPLPIPVKAFCLQSCSTDVPRFDDRLELPLLGDHQKQNAALAIAGLLASPAFRNDLTAPAVQTGLSRVQLPGRLELIPWKVTGGYAGVLLDIAHNPASIAALRGTIERELAALFPGEHRLVFACSRDKDARQMVHELLPAFDQIWWTQFSGNPRSRDAANLAEMAAQRSSPAGCRGSDRLQQVEPDAKQALSQAVAALRPGDLLVVTGSVFLVAELRAEVQMNRPISIS